MTTGARESHNQFGSSIVLENSPCLRHFSAGLRMIQVDDMVQPSNNSNNISSGTSTRTTELSSLYRFNWPHLFPLREAKPWACEGTLEYLCIGFRVASAARSDHQIVYRQLSRLCRLKTLILPQTNLIPAMGHGLELLGGGNDDKGEEGGDQQESFQSKTLQSILLGESPWVMDQAETLASLFQRLPALTSLQMKTLSPNGKTYQEIYEKCSRANVVFSSIHPFNGLR